MNLGLSEPPANLPPPNIGTKDARPPTFADVAMRLAYDGPVYMIIALVGVLAIRGQATALESVIAVMGALLSKSWPRPIALGMHVGIGLFFASRFFFGAS